MWVKALEERERERERVRERGQVTYLSLTLFSNKNNWNLDHKLERSVEDSKGFCVFV